MKTGFCSCWFLLLVLTAFPSCGKTENPKLSREKFSELYGRLMLVAETVQPTNDSLARLKKSKIDSACAEYGISEDEFRSMAEGYAKQPDVWATVLKEAAAKLDSLRGPTAVTPLNRAPRKEVVERPRRVRTGKE